MKKVGFFVVKDEDNIMMDEEQYTCTGECACCQDYYCPEHACNAHLYYPRDTCNYGGHYVYGDAACMVCGIQTSCEWEEDNDFALSLSTSGDAVISKTERQM